MGKSSRSSIHGGGTRLRSRSRARPDGPRVPPLGAVAAAYFIRNAGFAMLYLAMIFSIVPSFFIAVICSFMAFTSAGLSRRELKTVYALLTVSGMYSFAWMASYLRFHSGCWVASHALVGAPSRIACTRLAIRSWTAASIVL